MYSFNRFRQWVKARRHPLARLLYSAVITLRHASIPVVPVLHRSLYVMHLSIGAALSAATRILWYTPLFQSRLVRPAARLNLYGGIPLVTGPLDIEIGPDCRISAASTFSGRTATTGTPRLVIGGNVDIGWQTTVAVGRKVFIGDNVRIAGRAFLAGYPGHPIDALARATGLPDTEDQIGDIVLEDDVWLATGVTVLGGVTIGRGTIVAAGSVVTRDLPPFVLAAGAPARPIRPLAESFAKRQTVRQAA
ncbi:MAG: acyltransferase [Hyphomicrobiaceae bacterium]